jgi:hypothetical protein
MAIYKFGRSNYKFISRLQTLLGLILTWIQIHTTLELEFINLIQILMLESTLGIYILEHCTLYRVNAQCTIFVHISQIRGTTIRYKFPLQKVFAQ